MEWVHEDTLWSDRPPLAVLQPLTKDHRQLRHQEVACRVA
jgi:hypothetical protein